MIDALTFAHSYNAFWHSHAPTCEHFVRRLNIAPVDRFANPMKNGNSTNRALIAECGFSLFCEKIGDVLENRVRSYAHMRRSAWRIARARMEQYVGRGLTLEHKLSKNEQEEAEEIAARLERCFRNRMKGVVARPMFAGCGFVNRSEGDLVVESTIFEVKSVNRRLRSSDIRQLVTYAALNLSSRQFDISKIGVINPRRGELWQSKLDEVCEEIAGASTQDLLRALIHAMASGEISR